MFGRVLESGSDAPVSGAAVTLTGFFDPDGKPVAALPRSANPIVSSEASAPRTVVTNGEGYYVFRALPAGRYAIAVLGLGYVDSGYRLRVVEVAESGKPTASNLRIQKFAAITGRVVDEQGEPVVGIQITALQRLATSGGAVLRTLDTSAVAVTDDRGVYRLSQLAPGTYVVGALSSAVTLSTNFAAQIDAVAGDARGGFELRRQLIPGGAPLMDIVKGEGVRIGDAVLQRAGVVPSFGPDGKLLTYANTFVPGTRVAPDAMAVTLASGEQRTVADLPLHFSPAVRVSGVISGPAGPMPQMTVRLVPPSAADVNSADPSGVSVTFTDSQGAFTFLGVTEGQYTLQATRVIYEGADPANPEPTLWAAQSITVGETDVTGLNVAMRPGLRLRGRVEFKSSPGVAPESNPSQVDLHLRPIGAGLWRPGRGRSLPDGTFLTSGDPPGRYTLSPPFAPSGWTMETVTLNGRVLADDVIELESSDVTGLVVTFTKNVSRVSGTVVDGKSTPDNARDVVVFPADTVFWRNGVFNDRRTRFVHATSIGAFELSGLAPGDYYIAAVGGDVIADWPDPALLDRLVAGATKFTLASGDAPVLQLKTVSVRGR
ncbi:MAG TPA: carboxypeptidase-like regulatory domain-containing protein [Vicinamibacterales bacterium]|nr:carboxypeptidase-like regulatory domain-containing protein [Vicinamibacterales bacterium]